MASVLSMVRSQMRPALMVFVLLTLLLGFVYPFVVTVLAQTLFPFQANGNFVEHEGKPAGSFLIGQPFSSPKYFWGRPSATSTIPYNAALSSGSNLGPSNPVLLDAVKARVEALHTADPTNKREIPVDLITASGSGLDPDISIASANYQVSRVARERNMSEMEVSSIVEAHIESRQFGIFGEPHVNVLSLNLALDDHEADRGSPLVSHFKEDDLKDIEAFGMKATDWVFIILVILLLSLLIVPTGGFMARVYRGEKTSVSPLFEPVERFFLSVIGEQNGVEMDWKTFATSFLLLSTLSIFAVFLIQEVQQLLPLNPAGLGPVPWDLSLNTAVSFTTNTNWQAYAGETTVSYLTQMAALTVQNFISAAAGMAILVALILGFSRHSSEEVGNFWVLLIRSILILLPISTLIALLLVSQGVIQTLDGPVTVPFLDPVRDTDGYLVTTQTIPLGPAASQVAIKLLGTNGGGFFNTNSAHPFENPSPISNFIEILAILLIPVSLCYTFGKMVGSRRKGIALLVAMTLIFLPLLGLAITSEYHGNPLFPPLGIDQDPEHAQPGGNMEGKEVRFGIVPSAFFAVTTTATSCGAVNSMHDSFMPLGGFVLLFLILLGEVVFGGVGSGLYGMIVFVVIAMFIAGLMVGRTPEYLGKKIEPREMKIAAVIILVPVFLILACTAVALTTDAGRSGIFNPGPHGFSEVLYAFSSTAQNNGSAFGGLLANSLFYNISTAISMFLGRFFIALLTLALAGSFVGKKVVPESQGTLKDDSTLFILWLVFVVLVIGVLSYLPALALGPLVELVNMTGGV